MEENKNVTLTTFMESGSEDKEYRAEKIIFWAAGRAGIFAMSPAFSVPALIGNNTYMITSLARVYNVNLKKGAISGLVAGLGVACAGSLVSLALPFKVCRMPVAVGLTYALGKVAHIWIKDGMPNDVERYIPMLKNWISEGKAMCYDIVNDIKASMSPETMEKVVSFGSQAVSAVAGIATTVDELNTPEFQKSLKDTAESVRFKTHDAVAHTINGLATAVSKGPKAALEGSAVSETVSAVKKQVMSTDIGNTLNEVAESARYKVHDTAADVVEKVTRPFKDK
ncbi:hypothetical protein [Veillonella montpellierensis]|uniref:hypothetical protein n=1 Tax=Veillonella montpellierensis TaxID=187328 RepID=UPI0023F625AB|nr:hypothetical protein [Veillonella montpellierensis]